MVAFVSLCPHTEDGTRKLLGTFLKRALIPFMKAPPPRTITVGIRFQRMDFGWASTVAQTVKNLPAMRETQVRSLVRKIPWRRKWQLGPVFLPGKSHGQRSLVGYSPWGCRVGHNWATNTFTFHLWILGGHIHLIFCIRQVEFMPLMLHWEKLFPIFQQLSSHEYWSSNSRNIYIYFNVIRSICILSLLSIWLIKLLIFPPLSLSLFLVVFG